ncbi:MAG: HIT domain-containing protein [Caulobacteraceae bacterium]|nr:HIT domain-containing protein [Caulobacteraceae bacterium]
MFRLDSRLADASAPLAELPLCSVRLQAERRFLWLVLIPRVAGAVELEDLSAADRTRLMEELVLAGQAVRAAAAALGRPADKLNVGQLGNLVPQLHLHVVGRRRDDPFWPGPVWGHETSGPYGAEAAAAIREAVRPFLG